MAVAQEIKTTPTESYSPPPIVISNQTLSCFLSHNLSLEYMRNIMHGCHLTNTADRFQITDETASSLSFAIQEIPDQEAFANFVLWVVSNVEDTKIDHYPDHPYKIVHASISSNEEALTIISQPLPGELLLSALTTRIIKQKNRPVRITDVTYHFTYSEG